MCVNFSSVYHDFNFKKFLGQKVTELSSEFEFLQLLVTRKPSLLKRPFLVKKRAVINVYSGILPQFLFEKHLKSQFRGR